MPFWDSEGLSKLSYPAGPYSIVPTYQEICDKISQLFGDHVAPGKSGFSNYSVYGERNGKEFLLSPKHFVFTLQCSIVIRPIFRVQAMHIISWAQEYSRKKFVQLCKDKEVGGEIWRDSVNSLRAVVWHFSGETLESFMVNLRACVEAQNGHIDEDATVEPLRVGPLESSVTIHQSSSRRVDGNKSWEDEDARSRVTYFGAEVPRFYHK